MRRRTPKFNRGDGVLVHGQAGVIIGFDPRHCQGVRDEYAYLIKTTDGTTWSEESEVEPYESDDEKD